MNYLRLTGSFLLIVLFLGSAGPLVQHSDASTGALSSTNGKKDYQVKKGPEVAARVHKLKEGNKDVRAALKFFEDKQKPPKIEESSLLSENCLRLLRLLRQAVG